MKSRHNVIRDEAFPFWVKVLRCRPLYVGCCIYNRRRSRYARLLPVGHVPARIADYPVDDSQDAYVLAHEFGHAFGLKHNFRTGSLMNAFSTSLSSELEQYEIGTVNDDGVDKS